MRLRSAVFVAGSALAFGGAALAGGAVGGAYVDGPPPGHTGGFGEPTCIACHFENAPNDPAGGIELEGLPLHPVPGTAYELVLRVRHPDLRRAGFQLAARYSEGPREGEDAGVLEPGTGQRLVPHMDRLVTYLQHTEEGSVVEVPGAGVWSFRWIAPPDSMAVAFHVSANAANDNLSEFGDRIYTLQVDLPAPGAP